MNKIKNKNKKLNRKGKGIFGDILGTIGKSAYYVGAKLIDPFNDLKYGEIHTPVIKTSGSLPFSIGFSRSQGPGTDIINRVRENRLDSDTQGKISAAHDIRYILQPNKEREADIKFIKKASSVNSYNPLDFVNQQLGNLGIAGKVLAENIGLAKSGTFASTGGDLSKEDRDMLQNHLNKLEQEGYGRGHKKEKCYINHRTEKAKLNCKLEH